MPRDLVREDLAHSSRTWVVKVGTSVLAAPDGRLDAACVRRLADEVLDVVESGRRVALVSSGAVGAGIGCLGLSKRPSDLRHLQAAAAVGQSLLIRTYDEAFKSRGRHAAQVLLTQEDFDDRARYLNVRNTLLTLFEYAAIPIVNENDTVSVDEIRFGDNDHLAALLANALSAPLLVILSVVDGLFESEPETIGSPQTEAAPRRPLRLVADLDQAASMVGTGRSPLGSGGMASKLEAARLVTKAGGSVILASGTKPGALRRILAGEEIGTLIPAEGRSQKARRRWIGSTARPKGALVIDDGARRALEASAGSLLAIGVVEVRGRFAKGDVVSIRDLQGEEFARGLTNYAADEASKIAGLHTAKIAEALGAAPYDEVIHRDNLVLRRSRPAT